MTQTPENGGLGLVLPGEFYEQMLEARKTFLETGKSVFKQLKASIQEKLCPVVEPPRLYYALNQSKSLPDTGLSIILDHCFQPPLAKLHETCYQCGFESQGQEHVAFCNKQAGLWSIRHDQIALQLQQALHSYHPRKLAMADAVGKPKTFADIRVEQGVNVYDIDVSVTAKPNFEQRFAYKVAKHTKPMEGRILTVIPVVCDPFATLYDKSKRLLQTTFPNLDLSQLYEVIALQNSYFWLNSLGKQANRDKTKMSEQIEKIAAAVGYYEIDEPSEVG